MEIFELGDLLAQRQAASRLYLEFLHKATLSVGVYVLPAGGTDPQQPHTEDEVYFIVSGRARLRVGSKDAPVRPGSMVFVAAGVEHRFHDITEELIALVFFAPAEYSRR